MYAIYMPRILSFLTRVRRAIRNGEVVVSAKALDEAAEDLRWSRDEIIAFVLLLDVSDFERVEVSAVRPGDSVWVFCPEIDEGTLWIRIVARAGIIIVSFHLAGEP